MQLSLIWFFLFGILLFSIGVTLGYLFALPGIKLRVFSVLRTQLEWGDILFYSLPPSATDEDVERLKIELQEKMPKGTTHVVHVGNVNVSVFSDFSRDEEDV